MFETALLDRALTSSLDEPLRRGLTTLTSFGLQALAIVLLLILPLLRPMGLPVFRQLSTPVSLREPQSESSELRMHAASSAASANSTVIFLRRPPRIPGGPSPNSDDSAPQFGPPGPYLPEASSASGGGDGVLKSLGGDSRPIMPAAPTPVVRPVRLSHMSEGDLVRKVLPTYPQLARSARIQGQVVLQAVISKQGSIENLRLLSGHPMLAPAAIEAVSQWRYRPYILNNEPVEVETQITVKFSLDGN